MKLDPVGMRHELRRVSRVSDSVLGGVTVLNETLYPRSDMLETSESRVAIKGNDRFIWLNNGDQNDIVFSLEISIVFISHSLWPLMRILCQPARSTPPEAMS